MKKIELFVFLIIILTLSIGCKTGGVMEYQKNENNPQTVVKEFKSPSSVLTISVPDEMNANSTPKEEPVKVEMEPYITNKGSIFPAHGVYDIKSDDENFPYIIRIEYVCFDKEKIESETGQSFTPSIDGAAEFYSNSMKESSKSGSKATQNLDINISNISVDGKDARLINASFKNNGYPVINKSIYVVDNNGILWLVAFNCNGKEKTVSNKVDKVIDTIKFSK